MTVIDPPPQPLIFLSDKLMIITNLNNLIPVTLDIKEMNYSSWVYFIQNFLSGRSLLDHILGKDEDDTSSSTKTPPDAEWPKIDTIIVSWIVMSADVARGHSGDGGGDDRPPPYQVLTGCGGCLGKGTQKPNMGGRRAGMLHTRQETQNLGLKAITDKSGLVLIRFKVDYRETLMPLGDHAAHWANYLGEL
nr:hypothetical protein [Tanacetum cinerariifolium]